jgi:hypothetical protein
MIKTSDTQKYDVWRSRLYALFETLNIVAEIERHGGIKLTPVNKYNPRQYHGPCPWYLNCPEGDEPCDADEDGFLVWPTLDRELRNGDARPRHFWCRKCHRSGDIANFLERYYKISTIQACALLEVNPNDESLPTVDLAKVQKRGRSGPTNDQTQLTQVLMDVYPYAQHMLTHPRALAYLEGRSIPLEVAQDLGIGYIPVKSDSAELRGIDDQWCDKILFPAQSPDGALGFRGRTLTRWRPGMDEKEHRDLLQTHDIAPWLATYEDGYFNWQALHSSECPVLVEGGFDVLACHVEGIQAIPIGASKLPPLLKVRQAILALDNDESGRDAMKWALTALRRFGVGCRVCIPPAGAKDWSEAYRLLGAQGLAPLKFCEDCDISNFASRKPFQGYGGRVYCVPCFPDNHVPSNEPDLFDVLPEQCEDCGTAMAAEDRGFLAFEYEWNEKQR